MKIYKMNKIYLTIQIIIGGIILPILIIFLIAALFNINPSDNNNFIVLTFLPFLLASILSITQYFLKIVINNKEISNDSIFGKIVIRWEDLIKLEFKINKKIILYGNDGQKLYYQYNIVDYKSLYYDIYEQIKLHGKESIVDESFLDYMKSV
ncbi:hypothetical protein KHQ81_07075 [Mycoplasmatota bacterium]|nr:hypothetical protein KHQ81_07075 [Mycoplasmatota bacterium]